MNVFKYQSAILVLIVFTRTSLNILTLLNFYGLLRFNTFALSRKSIKVLLLNYSWLCYLLEWLLVTPIFDSLSSINILSWSLSLIKGRTPGFLLFSLNVNYCKQSHKSFIFWNMSWVCWSRHSNFSNCWYIYWISWNMYSLLLTLNLK